MYGGGIIILDKNRRVKDMRGRRKRSLALGILCCLLVFMGIGFAAARTTLNITGTSTITNAWDVRLSNVLVTNASDGVTNNEEFTNLLDEDLILKYDKDTYKGVISFPITQNTITDYSCSYSIIDVVGSYVK